MKFLLALTVLVSVSYVSSRSGHDADVSDHQAQVLKLYQGLGTEDTHDFVRKDFPFADAKYYKEPSVVAKFVEAYNNGFLDKEGYFSLYSYKNRHDTYRLFDLFYFAKDFDTFIKIATWAKDQLNPLQFVHAFTSAIYKRQDTQGVIPPPLYEVLPSYYTPSHVIVSAYKAMIHDVKYRKFEVNATSFEYSWYKDQTVDKYKFSPNFNEYDIESRLAYYREDVGHSDWFTKYLLRIAPWLSDEKYPDFSWGRRGETMFIYLKWILMKYNLERYANGLPPVEPINFHKMYKTGYNPHIINVAGRPFMPRPDSHNPFYTNPSGVQYLDNMYQRYFSDVDAQTMFFPMNGSTVSIEGVEGFETFCQTFFGIAHPAVRKYYRPLFYQALEAFDQSVRSSNDLGYTSTVLGHYLTETRDPAFYSVLAYLYKLFSAYQSKKMPYTTKDIEFPGVKINSFDFSKLETYFEWYDYDISNGVPFKDDAGKYKYLVSRKHLNHKPFTYTVNVQSDKQVEAMVKIYLAPKYDSNKRPYGFSAFSKYAYIFDMFYTTLKPGSNSFERDLSHDENYHDNERIKHINERIQRAKNSGSPLFYSKEKVGAYPFNLVLPRGTKEGTEFQAFAIVYPKGNSHYSKDDMNEHLIQEYDSSLFIDFPFDRPVYESAFHTDNVYVKDITIYDATKY